MHPYKGRPADNFWKSGVASKIWSDIDFKIDSRFQVSPEDKIATAGSCFAQHIARRLPELGLRHFVAETPPPIMKPERAAELQYGQFSARYGNIYTAKQLRQLIEFAFELRPRALVCEQTGTGWADLLRPGIDAANFPNQHDLECDREFHLNCVKSMFEEADIFVFTLGLTETWYDTTSDIVFPACPGTRVGTFKPQQHKFVNADVLDIIADLQWCVNFIAGKNPGLKWIFTVSPVALAATATNQNVLVATTASKSILRAAASHICAANEQCDYFPSFEIVSSAQTFGQFLDADLRTISPRGVDLVMRNFKKAYIEGAVARADPTTPAVTAAPAPVSREEMVQAAVQKDCDEAFNDPNAF